MELHYLIVSRVTVTFFFREKCDGYVGTYVTTDT
jgi:hypothetical protein